MLRVGGPCVVFTGTGVVNCLIRAGLAIEGVCPVGNLKCLCKFPQDGDACLISIFGAGARSNGQ